MILTRCARFAMLSAALAAFAMTVSTEAQADGPRQRGETDRATLLAGFTDPPQEARPRVWWHWMDGNVSAAGAQLDLAWMRRVGIGGVHIFSGSLGEPIVVERPQPFMSEAWRQTFRASVESAQAAGMEVGIAGSPGWSETGGPWVRAEDGMKKYVWSETHVTGGRPFTGVLAAPPDVTGPFQAIAAKGSHRTLYRDSYVVAYPTPLSERQRVPTIRASDPGADLTSLTGPALAPPVKLSLGADGSAWIEAQFPTAAWVASLTLGLPRGGRIALLASEDGHAFRRVATTDIASPAELTSPLERQTIAVTPTRARIFRLVLRPIVQAAPLAYRPGPAPVPAPLATSVQLSQIVFGGARVNRFEAKAGFQPTIEAPDAATPAVPARFAIAPARIVDLTRRLHPDGRLTWTPPRGEWTVLRFGWSLTGAVNEPAEPAATGLEVDKFDPAAVRRYMTAYLGLYGEATDGRLGPAGIGSLLTDSWEAGVQNWSPVLPDELRRRRGYDLRLFLPVLAGRIVGSADASDRFLWDFRRTLKELVADNHHRVLADMLHDRGMTYYTEAQGDTPRAIADGMTLKARSDVPTAEYWYRPFAAGAGQYALHADLKEAASSAHVYGRRLAAAEALTVAAGHDPWSFSPAMLKPAADQIFASGINRLLIHDSHHQPLVDAPPGLMLLIFGQFFNRSDNWAEQARPWVDYLARTSFLLQQGHAIVDIGYVYGEDRTPSELFRTKPDDAIPAGFASDYINPEALYDLLSVRDGRVVTPGGASYALLYLGPNVDRLTLRAARRLRDLVAVGAVLVGRKPRGGLGLASPNAEVLAIVDVLWRRARSGGAFGRGRVYSTMAQALAVKAIAPDVGFGGGPPLPILFAHRRTATSDIYFVSNQSGIAQQLDATFRVRGRAPELWRAETGAIETLSYRQGHTRTTVPLALAAHEAVFVVFSRRSDVAAWRKPPATTTPLLMMSGPWSIAFQPGRGAPAGATFETLASWTTSATSGIRYFSGTATYSRAFAMPANALADGRRYVLDLGDVRELASVTINGRPVGTAWHPPYLLDVTNALTAGENVVRISVTNLWPNRLIGDRQPGATRIAFAPQSPYTATSPLLPSGLLGPVRLLAIEQRPGPAKRRSLARTAGRP